MFVGLNSICFAFKAFFFLCLGRGEEGGETLVFACSAGSLKKVLVKGYSWAWGMYCIGLRLQFLPVRCSGWWDPQLQALWQLGVFKKRRCSFSERKAYLGLLATGLSGAGEARIRLCNLPDQLWFD